MKRQEANPLQHVRKRSYDSTRRQLQARETRMQILRAAHALFVDHGYAGTTVEAIAQRAGVAKETVYSIFKSKWAILINVLDVAIGGDNQPVQVMDRAETQAMLHATDQRHQLATLAVDVAKRLGRAAPIFEVMRVAAKTEPEINARVKHLQHERRANMTVVLGHIALNGSFRNSLDATRAGEIVWALASPELFLLLTTELHWTAEQYATWLTDTLVRTLLP